MNDAQRGKEFSKLAREITVAAGEGGGDPATNPRLRMVMEKARAANMPSANVERAAKKGTGEEAGGQLQEILVEAYGPGGTALLLEGITDNKNRALGEIKQIFNKHQGKLVGEGAVRWLFEQRGVITLNAQDQNKEKLELLVIESGAEDLYWHEGFLEVYVKPAELEKVRSALEAAGLSIESSSLDWVPKERVAVGEKEGKATEALFEALGETEAVQEIYSNLET